MDTKRSQNPRWSSNRAGVVERLTAVSGGWPKVLSNLKSLLETGSVALLEAYPAAQS